jgi:hypothetical protein
MDATKLPDGEDIGAIKGAWQWVVFFCGLVATGAYAGRKAGKAEQAVSEVIGDVERIKAEKYCTEDDCTKCQARCQQHTWDKLLLALEKRDRDFDRKFSTICQGIAEIKAEIRK